MLKMCFAIAAVIVLTVVPALLHGRFSNRWSESPNLSLAGEQLHKFPKVVGQWRNAADERPLSEEVCRELGLVEHFHRIYTHAESGDQLEVLLMVGPPGRLVRHPPDICYANRANQQIGEATSLEVVNAAEFKVLKFKRTQVPIQREFSVAYAYSTSDGVWSTPTSPRLEFGAAPVLYKLQVLSAMPEQQEKGHRELNEFLTRFVEAFPAILDEKDVSAAVPANVVEVE